MNPSPWYVQNTADYERKRIRDDMSQIRLEQKAMKGKTAKTSFSTSWLPALRAIRNATLAVTDAVLGMLA